ncbi:hydantoinase/oxoprolinase N-terminal domain-containing protein [Cohnella thermotolerans]|uniref:hydantoinase/oxoprolinase N-terminal domain-containing protein n=1 Tax=Cohnella thermotolerans TaxID=329858 RepID=UPI00041890B1|nr:hydantoinase/oxoprolinase family protein [Cohnella thermotolerans]
MRIGIDVGGTNTDAVLMDGTEVLASFKTATTPDIMTGMMKAVAQMAEACGDRRPACVMAGTTHFANALVERKRLSRTAVLRLGKPYGAAIPPFAAFPGELAEVVQGPVFLLSGGHEFDGREITPFRPEEIVMAAERLQEEGIRTAVVSSPFSPVNDEMERRAAELVRSVCPDIRITKSSEIGSVGLLERENAAILNASLSLLAEEIVDALRNALRELGLDCPFYLTQNDGTLMNADYARKYPVLTLSSGPTNSMRGAAYLSGLKDAIVIDIGGTTADIGILSGGFPLTSSRTSEIAGVRTNFRIPDVYCLGLGGGSRVRKREDGGWAIGPDSVGYRIREEACVFGGSALTMTDAAAAAGVTDVGDAARVPLTREEASSIMDEAARMLDAIVDRMKPGKEPLPVVAVGGGSVLLAKPLPSASRVVKAEHYAVANAIGAAIAQVGGEIDRIFSLEGRNREDVLAEAKQLAVNRAVDAGAAPETVEIVSLHEVPLSYLPGSASRIRVKAVGQLKGANA